MSNLFKKSILIFIIIMAMVLSLSTVAFAADPLYIYYENEDGHIVRASYQQAVDNLPDDTTLQEAIREAIRDAIERFDRVYIEDQNGSVIDYAKAFDGELSYPEALADLATYGVDRPEPEKELIIDPDTGEAVEVWIRRVVSVQAIDDITVDYGTSLAAVRNQLPSANDLVVNLSNDTTSPAEQVYWDDGTPTYDGMTARTYSFEGQLTMPDGITNPDNIKAQVNVIVLREKTSKVTFSVKDTRNDPLAGAVVNVSKVIAGSLTSVLDTPSSWVQSTGANGQTDFNLIDGDYSYEVTKDNHFDESGSFKVAGADKSINVTLQADLGDIKITKNPDEITGNLYTLAGDGAREFTILYRDKSGASLNSGKVRVNFYDDQHEVAEQVTASDRTILDGHFNELTKVNPTLVSGLYTMVVSIDYNNDDNFDFTSDPYTVYVGKVEVDGLFETFMSVNDALAAGGDGALVKLYEDVDEDVDIESEEVTLDLNGFTVGNVNIGEDAKNPYIKGSTIDGDLTISWDGVVTVDDSVHITGDIVFKDVSYNNAEIDGNPSIGGKKVYASLSVESAGGLHNALSLQTENIFLSGDITWTSDLGNLTLRYVPATINLGAHKLNIEGQDIVISANAVIEAGVNGGIKGVTGSEQIIVQGNASATIRGAAGTNPPTVGGLDNVMNLEDIELIDVNPGSELTLSKVHFDEGESNDVEFNIAGTLNIEEYVTSNDVQLTFINGLENPGNWNTTNNSFYGTIRGDGEIKGTGKIVISDAPNYRFIGYGGDDTELLTISLPMEVRIEDEEILTPNNRNLIIADLELLDQIRLYNDNNVIVDGGTGRIKGGSGDRNQGRIVGSDGTSDSDFRVVVNRSYLGGTGTATFEDMTFRQVAFNVQSNTSIKEHTFHFGVFVEVNNNITLTAVDTVDVRNGDVEFGRAFWNNVGTFYGPGATVTGSHSVLFTDEYTVLGNSWFTFAVPIKLESDVTFAYLALNEVKYEGNYTVDVIGDLIAYTENDNVYGEFVGTNSTSTIISVEEQSVLNNLTFTDIETLTVNANTIIEDALETGIGLDVRFQSNQETNFDIINDISLIVVNTAVRVDEETLILTGSGAVRGVGGDGGGRFFTNNTGRLQLAEGSNDLMLFGDGNGNLVFDLAVHVEDGSSTDLGIVSFNDWVYVNNNETEATSTLRVISNKIASFVKGIDIEDGATLNMETRAIYPPVLPGIYVMIASAGSSPAALDYDDENIRGKIMGVNNGAQVRGEGTIVLGRLLKVENFTFRDSLDDVNLTDASLTDDLYILTFADVTIEAQTIDFLGWELYLDNADVELVEVDNVFPALIFETLNSKLAKLHGQGNTIYGDGNLAFRSSDDREAEAEGVTFDIRRHSFPYEVNVGQEGDAEKLVIFKNVEWTSQTTVNVNTDSNLRLEGTCVNNGGLRVWSIAGDTNEIGLENRSNLTRSGDNDITLYNR